MTVQAQARPASTVSSVWWILWIAFSCFVNFNAGLGFYSSQVLLILGGTVWTVFQIYKFNIGRIWIPFFFSAFILWCFVIENNGGSSRFFPELSKLCILAFTFMILVDLKVESYFDSITLALPSFASVLIVYTRLFGQWDTYDPLLHRFGIPQFGGSPNTASYIFAFCMLMVHYQWGIRRTNPMRILLIVSFGILIYGMLASQSRGGLIAYIAGSLFLLKRRWRVAGVVVIAILLVGGALLSSLDLSPELARFNLLMDASDTGGTGRSFIWAALLSSLFQHPVRILWGNGPGAINFYLFGQYLIQSGHSVYVEIFYSYGLIGLTLLGARLFFLYRHGTSHLFGTSRRQINLAIWAGLVVDFAFDSDPLAAQILWFTPLLGALLISDRQSLENQVTQSFVPDLPSGGRDLDYPEIFLQQ